MIRLLIIALIAAAVPAQAVAESLSLSGSFDQGGMVVGRTEAGAAVTLNGKDLRVAPDGTFVFGIHRDDTGSLQIMVTLPNGQKIDQTATIADRTYDIQRIDGLPPKKVTPPEALLTRIRQEAERVREARKRDTPIVAFADPFLWPVDGRISGVYGSQRILNGQPRQPHYGVDIAAPTGTPVAAPAPGIISLVEDDLYFSGGTIMIDHGHGIASTFLHMHRIDVKLGDEVRRGDPIGTVGATGRATGPHLDWRVNWFEKRLDPQLLSIEK